MRLTEPELGEVALAESPARKSLENPENVNINLLTCDYSTDKLIPGSVQHNKESNGRLIPMTRTARILVTDDDERLRQATADMLQEEGYVVAMARDGNELLRTYRKEPFDLVVCDVFMPGKDGLEIIGELLKEYPAAKIVAMSGGGQEGSLNFLKVALHLGAKDMLPKPFTRAKLMEVVKRVLAS